MQMDEGDARSLGPVTQGSLGVRSGVADTLGHWFAEKGHGNALAYEMQSPSSLLIPSICLKKRNYRRTDIAPSVQSGLGLPIGAPFPSVSHVPPGSASDDLALVLWPSLTLEGSR
jgi:hypothetical protein